MLFSRPRQARPWGVGPRASFTLVEMLVSIAILVIIMGVIFAITQQTARVYKSTGEQMEAFRSARNAFESMTRNLSLATLNNYYDYVNAAGLTRAQDIKSGDTGATNFAPTGYARVSDLHYASGWYTAAGPTVLYNKQVTHSVFFQSPLGYTTNSGYASMENMVNACGYYIEYKADSNQPTYVSATPVYRYRLMEFIQPSEIMTVYSTTDTSWFTTPLATPATAPVHQLAANIIALIILPRANTAATDTALGTTDAITNAIPTYIYDSRANTVSAAVHNQLPPLLDVVMVAIDEASAARLLPNTSTPPSVIQTALRTSTRFQSVAKMDADLAALGTALTAAHINYRIFRTLVSLHDSKWSNQ